MPEPAPVRDRCREHKEHEIAARHEGARQAILGHRDCGVARERGVRDFLQGIQVYGMVLRQPPCPQSRGLTELLSNALPAIEFDRVALTVVEADRLDPLKAIEGPSETYGR